MFQLANSLFDSLHHVLQIGEDVSVGLVTVLRHQLAVYYHIKLAMGSVGEFEMVDLFAGPAECLTCNPGSSGCVPSILAIGYLKGQLVGACHGKPPILVRLTPP